MFCPSCGKEIPDGSTFCLHCGKAVGATAEGETRKHSSKLLVALGVGAVVILLAVILGVTVREVKTPNELAPSPAAGTPPTPLLRPVTVKLASGQLVVRAGKYVSQRFAVDPLRMQQARVIGHFRASGGAGNDIQVVLADEDAFENWINGHQAQVLYATDKLTNGSIDVPVTQAGTYYLAFSNTFSTVSDKDVFAEIELRYLTPQ